MSPHSNRNLNWEKHNTTHNELDPYMSIIQQERPTHLHFLHWHSSSKISLACVKVVIKHDHTLLVLPLKWPRGWTMSSVSANLKCLWTCEHINLEKVSHIQLRWWEELEMHRRWRLRCASHRSVDSELTEAGALSFNLPGQNLGMPSQSQPPCLRLLFPTSLKNAVMICKFLS